MLDKKRSIPCLEQHNTAVSVTPLGILILIRKMNFRVTMPAYHSRLTSNECLGNMAVLPLKTQVRGPAPCLPPSNEEDIIDEALYYFKVGLNSIENKGLL